MGSYDKMEAGRRTPNSKGEIPSDKKDTKGGAVDFVSGKAKEGNEGGMPTKTSKASGGIAGDYSKAGNGGKQNSW